jgi:hypothetical protein
MQSRDAIPGMRLFEMSGENDVGGSQSAATAKSDSG